MYLPRLLIGTRVAVLPLLWVLISAAGWGEESRKTPPPPEKSPSPVPQPVPGPVVDWRLAPGQLPVLFVTTETLGRLKRNVARNEEPWKSAWEEILSAADQGLQPVPRPYAGEDFVQMRYAALEEFGYASAMALRWRVTGEIQYAEGARKILLAWATAEPRVGSTQPVIGPKDPRLPRSPWGNIPDIGLNFADLITAYAHAYATLYPYLSKNDVTSIEPWMRYVAGRIEENHRQWLEHKCYGHQHFNNHLSVHNMGLAAIGFALRDERLVRLAFTGPGRGYFDMLCGAILMPEEGETQFWHKDPRRETLPGEIYDRYRVVTVRDGKGYGLPYSFLHLEALTYTAEMAFNNGIDLYGFTGPAGENLRLPCLYLAPILTTMNPAHYGDYHANDLIQPERVGLYEIASRRLGPEPAFEDVLKTLNRAMQDDSQILGHASLLLYGE